MFKNDTVQYRFIGVIHSPFREQKETPIQSIFSTAEGRIEVFPAYSEGLDGLGEFSHLYLIYHFHHAKPGPLREIPFLDGERARGIFSIRHFNRPNPIGLSIVKLNRIEDNMLFVGGIDVLDGTPLLDIKPYISRFDHREGTRNGWVDIKEIGDITDSEATPGRLQET